MNFLFTVKFFKVLFLSIVIFIILDYLWLAVIARKLYFDQLSYLANVANGEIVFLLPVGILVQAIIAAGFSVFISIALQVKRDLLTSIITGAFLGFVLYCTYDLTNLSFVKGYKVFISIIDITWGTAQGVFAGIYVYYLNKLFFKLPV
ncbi:MAG: DUF2177 family protein [Spirochaetes bacterium]|nr:DUF2177 family protein [Spirochaetota bacterium]